MRRLPSFVACLLLAGLTCGGARADVALLMEEPYGRFGGMNPTGHAAIYLDRVCADSPTRLRMCRAGEAGVVISRYHRIHGYDWLAVPLVPYLYAVDRTQDIPARVDAETVLRLRDEYRRKNLLDVVPSLTDPSLESDIPRGDWYMLAGGSYDRKIYGLQLETTPQADQSLVDELNARENVGHFNIVFRNCADFARVVLDHYYPHAVHRNLIVDFGVSTPQQDARSLEAYAKRYSDLKFTAFLIPQVPGLPRSKPVDGVTESVLKSKKYVVPLAVLHPEVTAGLLVVYLAEGRFKTPKHLQPFVIPQQVKDTSQSTKGPDEQISPLVPGGVAAYPNSAAASPMRSAP